MSLAKKVLALAVKAGKTKKAPKAQKAKRQAFKGKAVDKLAKKKGNVRDGWAGGKGPDADKIRAKNAKDAAVKKKAGGKLAKRLWKWVTNSDGDKKKVYVKPKNKVESKGEKKSGRLVQGAGDSSHTPTGKAGSPNQRQGGTGNPEEKGHSIKSVDYLDRKSSAKKSYDWAKTLPKEEAMALVDKFQKLLPARKASIKANIRLGNKTPYDAVAKKIMTVRASKKNALKSGSSNVADSTGKDSRSEARAKLKSSRTGKKIVAPKDKTKELNTADSKKAYTKMINTGEIVANYNPTQNQIKTAIRNEASKSISPKRMSLLRHLLKKNSPKYGGGSATDKKRTRGGVEGMTKKTGGTVKPKKSVYKTGGTIKRKSGGKIGLQRGWGKARTK